MADKINIPTSVAPFACSFEPATAELLWSQQCSLVISTYQAGKVIVLSPKPDGGGIHQLPRTFEKAMGLAVSDSQMAVAARNKVIVMGNSPGLAATYPSQPDTYDNLYIPRATYNTGELDIHDLAFASQGRLVAANTRFSCLSTIDHNCSATPFWTPSFISERTQHDQCHLNGLAVDDEGECRYVTALGTTDTPEGWRDDKLEGGVVIDVDSGEIVLDGLAMPHSPRLIDGKLFVLVSASAELICLDLESGARDLVARLPGFARGLARYGDYLYVGISRLRPNHKFGDLPIAKQPPFCGVVIVHLPTGAIAGSLQYQASCEEIYDVQVLPNQLRPGIVRIDDPFVHQSLVLPDNTYLASQEDSS